MAPSFSDDDEIGAWVYKSEHRHTKVRISADFYRKLAAQLTLLSNDVIHTNNDILYNNHDLVLLVAITAPFSSFYLHVNIPCNCLDRRHHYSHPTARHPSLNVVRRAPQS